MNDYWHIPRASLAASSNASTSAASLASSSNRSNRSTNSNPPTMRAMNKNYANADLVVVQEKQNQKQNQRNYNNNKTNPPRIHQNVNKNKNEKSNGNGGGSGSNVNGKRGSRSSQGSSDSNNSTRSTASGSLLLTAANLERFAEIQRKQQQLNKNTNNNNNKFYLNEESTTTTTMVHQSAIKTNHLNANLMQALATSRNQQQQPQQHQQQQILATITNTNDDATIIQMDPNLDFVKTKDLDSVSIASSMHFTMVNGEGGQTKKQKRGLCDRGRQVTVLIVSMSTIFLLLIMGMVYALEMRAREMPQS